MKNNSTFALKGNILYSKNGKSITQHANSYLVCENDGVAGVFETLPEKFAGIEVKDQGNRLIIPGLVDLHLHAPQYAFRALGMDLELLQWLNTHTFPAEAKYSDIEYAKKAYTQFTDALVAGATTRAVVFATIHLPATLLLMEMLENSGLVTMVGKVNMDRNSPDILCEASAAESLAVTGEWLRQAEQRFTRTQPILTPRFIPSCTNELIQGLAQLQSETGLPVQSHLSENLSEVDWVRELCPEAAGYADAYRRFGLFGGAGCPTVMAHCVHMQQPEIEMMLENGVYVAHCPTSNTNLSSGIAPVRQFLNDGVKVGLGTDMAGGHSLSMLRAMADAVQVSKLRWRLVDDTLPALTLPEVFYLATKGGGAFFGKVGSFEKGYSFDAVVLDDSSQPTPDDITLQQRLERLVYLGSDADVTEKYAAGRRVK